MIDLARLPRLVKERLASTRRDLGMIAMLVQGTHPPPLIPIAARKGTQSGVQARALRVQQVVRETPQAVTLWLVDPSGAPLHCQPGQFFTVLVPAPEEPVTARIGCFLDMLSSSFSRAGLLPKSGGLARDLQVKRDIFHASWGIIALRPRCNKC